MRVCSRWVLWTRLGRARSGCCSSRLNTRLSAGDNPSASRSPPAPSGRMRPRSKPRAPAACRPTGACWRCHWWSPAPTSGRCWPMRRELVPWRKRGPRCACGPRTWKRTLRPRRPAAILLQAFSSRRPVWPRKPLSRTGLPFDSWNRLWSPATPDLRPAAPPPGSMQRSRLKAPRELTWGAAGPIRRRSASTGAGLF